MQRVLAMTRPFLAATAALAAALAGFAKAPDTLAAGGFSVFFKLNDSWTAKVYQKAHRIVYEQAAPFAGAAPALQLTVLQVALPSGAARAAGPAIAAALVGKDGLGYQRAFFNHLFYLPDRPSRVPCPIGTAFVYGQQENPVYSDGIPHFARVALVLPSDYATRLVAYLVVEHQAGGDRIGREQSEEFDNLIQGIKVAAPGAKP